MTELRTLQDGSDSTAIGPSRRTGTRTYDREVLTPKKVPTSFDSLGKGPPRPRTLDVAVGFGSSRRQGGSLSPSAIKYDSASPLPHQNA